MGNISGVNLALFRVLLLSFLAIIAHCEDFSSSNATVDDSPCVYTVYTKTAHFKDAQTRSKISLAISGPDRNHVVQINDLASSGAGLMGPNHVYFQQGNIDIFSFRGTCLRGPPCWMKLWSAGNDGWYASYVSVSMTGLFAPSSQRLFTVDTWLWSGVWEGRPYTLTNVQDYCYSAGSALTQVA